MIENSAPTAKPRKLRRRILQILGLLMVLALIGGTGFILFMKIKFADFQPPMGPSNVVVSTAKTMTFVDSIEAVGTTVAGQSATLTATVTETIKAINAEEGQFVSAGTPVVDLNDDQEKATLDQATKSYNRYNSLAKSNLGSVERRDEEEAAMNVAKAQVDKRNIRAPFDGFLGIRHVNIGDLVTPGTVITTIDSIDPIKLDFTIPETYLSVVKEGLDVTATTAAWPDEVFKGKIYVLDTRVDPATRAIMVRAMLPNPDKKLKAGLLMRVHVIRSSKDALAVPEEAILAAGSKKTVFVVGADKKVAEKEVTLGQREPGYVEILSGLNAGDKVVIEGQMKTRPGADVLITGEKDIAEVVKDAVSYALPRKQAAMTSSEKTGEEKTGAGQ